jgi:hypothetical protein
MWKQVYKHENEAEGPTLAPLGPSASFSCLSLYPHLLVKIQNSFLRNVLKKDYFAPLTIAREKQT